MFRKLFYIFVIALTASNVMANDYYIGDYDEILQQTEFDELLLTIDFLGTDQCCLYIDGIYVATQVDSLIVGMDLTTIATHSQRMLNKEDSSDSLTLNETRYCSASGVPVQILSP